MFNANDILDFVKFLKDYEIDFSKEGIYLDFCKEEDGIYHHSFIQIETFEARPMWKNIERIRAEFDITD